MGIGKDLARGKLGEDMLVSLLEKAEITQSYFNIIESLEFGLPCVAWDIPGVNEDVYDGVTGKVSPFGDHNHVADSIEAILENPVELNRLSKGATMKFNQYSVKDYAGKILNAYKLRREIINPSSQKSR